MSAVPPTFVPQTSFSTLATQPISTTGLPGSELDGEFSRASTSINEIRSRLSEIQRDDGQLRNGSVTTASLSAEVINGLIATGVTPRSWIKNAQYDPLDLVSIPQGEVIAVSGTFTPPFSGSLIRIDDGFYDSGPDYPRMTAEWDGGQWTLGLILNDSISVAWFSEEAVASPDLVETWIPSGAGEFMPTGSPILTELNGPPGTFLCIIAHTSSNDFNADLINWALIAAPPVAGSLQTNTFTGDGATTAFTLSAAPVSTSNAQVFIDGVYQPKSSYVISGFNLTFSEAPSTGAEIEAVLGVPAQLSITTVADGSVTTEKLVNGSVTTDKLAASSVTGAKLAASSVTSDKLAPASVIAGKIDNNAVISTNLALNSVTETKVVDGAISEAKIRNDAVTTNKIINGAVTGAKIANEGVGVLNLANNSVTNPKVADLAITGSKLADLTIPSEKLADSSVTTSKVNNASITAAKLSGAQTGEAPIYGVRAFARVQSNGTAIINVGFETISRFDTGTYILVLANTPTSDPVVTATCHAGNSFNYSADVEITSLTSFVVRTGFEDVWSISDSPFSIMVIY